SCSTPPPPPPGSCSNSAGAGSIDPNDKAGPVGTGPSRWVAGQLPITYAISFENEPQATASAQRVSISDQLDPAKIDLSSVSLGPMGFGSTLITPPPGVNIWSTVIDLGTVGSVGKLLVDVQGSLDAATGLLRWTFQAIDAATGLPPDDPLVGLLPPNTAPPAGAGAVMFTARPKSALADGTQVSNQAAIVFDQNAPIPTPTWTNTLAQATAQQVSVSPRSLSFAAEETVGGSGQPSAPKNVTIRNPAGGGSIL